MLRSPVSDLILGERGDQNDVDGGWDLRYDVAGNTSVLAPLAAEPAPDPDGETLPEDSEPETVPPPELTFPEPAPTFDSPGSIVEEVPQRLTPPDEIDAAQILRDRPDVFAAYFTEFHGPNNDRHSSAWIDRVGGESPEDFARYWYKTYGVWEGYRPGGVSSAPDIGGLLGSALDGEPSGRTTADGIELTQILRDRPDVFRAFFTEFYGRNNDHSSDAWFKRVGGASPEDYANYWYETYGRFSGYTPSNVAPAPTGDGDEAMFVLPPLTGDAAPLDLLVLDNMSQSPDPAAALGADDDPAACDRVEGEGPAIIPVGHGLMDDGPF